MSEDNPRRLSESPEDDGAGALLRDAIHESKRDLPDETRLAAIALKLGPLVGGAAGGGGAAAAGGAGAAKASVAPVTAKIGAMTASMKLEAAVAVTAIAIGGGAVVAPRILGSRAAAPTTPTASAMIATTTSAGPTTISGSLPPASASAQALPVPTSPPAATMIKPPNPDDEVRTLDRAQDALASDPESALSLCNDDAILFAHGPLAQEREVIAIDALTRLGRMTDAKARAKKFAHDFPSSAALPRVHKLIGDK